MNNQESHTKTLQKAIRKATLKKEAEKFKQFLSVAGISSYDASRLCHVTDRAVAYWVSGDRPVPLWAPELIALKLANPREVLP